MAEGAKKTLTIRRHIPCDTCEGSGSADRKPPVSCGTCGGRGHVLTSWERLGQLPLPSGAVTSVYRVGLAEDPASPTVFKVYFPPGCTIEAKTFRDSYEDFAAAGAQVVGVSADSAESHCGFREKHDLPFILLTDPGWKVAKKFGIAKTWGFMPGRETFIIDKDGTVMHSFRSQFNAKAHVKEALEVLQANA